MEALRTGLYSKLTASSTITDYVSTRVYFQEGPPDATFPYIVFSFISETSSWGFGGSGPTNQMRLYRVQFSIYDSASSPTQIETITANLRTLLDWSTVTVAGYSTMRIQHDGTARMRDDIYWHNAVDYLIELAA